MPGTIDMLLRLAISMAVVMGVMGLAAHMLRRRANKGSLPGNGMFALLPRAPRTKKLNDPELDVVYRRPLSKGTSVALVKADGKRYLLGVSERAVTLLARLPDQPPPQPKENLPIVLTKLGNEDDRTSPSLAALHPAARGEGQPNAWKLALDSLRERTVRR
ncbi:MAG: FliO/MopB family protein [Acidimicrobiales bacterium]